MVTGRELEELKLVCPYLDRFEWIVAENGGLLYCPARNELRLLCEPPDAKLVQRLRDACVQPLSIGHTIIATREPHEKLVLSLVKELGLELQVIFNKGAVMILPTGVNKASGLALALEEMHFLSSETVGVGDAENDHAFLELCAIGVAVSNALPMLKERADFVTKGARGDGVVELIDQILRDDLAHVQPRARQPQPVAALTETIQRT